MEEQWGGVGGGGVEVEWRSNGGEWTWSGGGGEEWSSWVGGAFEVPIEWGRMDGDNLSLPSTHANNHTRESLTHGRGWLVVGLLRVLSRHDRRGVDLQAWASHTHTHTHAW
mgnify:CR=1 FL=1